jgi:hypothetical protein
MHKLSTRCRNQHWEVLVPGANCEVWIQCKSIVDARRMAVSGNLAFDAFQGSRAGGEIAQALDDCTHLFLDYDCHERAAWLAEHAKFARGEPSLFAGAHSNAN